MLAVGYLTLPSTPANLRLFVTGAKAGQWKRICNELVTRLDDYSVNLRRNIRNFLQSGDSRGAEIIQSSCVGCLTYLVVLCDLTSQLEPNSKLKMDAVCDLSLERLSHLTQEMAFDGYSCFDLLLRVRHWVGLLDSEQTDNVID